MDTLFHLSLLHDQDVVTSRQRAAALAALLGFDSADQTRIATAVSEIARNAWRYAAAGQVTFAVDTEVSPQSLVVEIRDQGPGIPDLDVVLSGRYRSASGMGIGIASARRLMDTFAVDSSPNGTAVHMRKALPRTRPITREEVRRMAAALTERPAATLAEEFQRQNQELLRAFDELSRKQQELVRLNRELEDTNRGVVALYAELDEKADHLRRADQLKLRFLSNMTHEFRTPVNSIIGLCNLLVEDRRHEGRDVEPEIAYIRKAADQLSELVNDLLDLAKVEAGKVELRTGECHVHKLFGALRGMLRPLLLNQSVALVFEDADDIPPMQTDEGKVSQILRNLISNALKFTERGEVRVSARVASADRVAIAVADTGIGIAAEDQQRIFDEFAQVEHRLQRGVRGTGLGLSLSRKLAELLGGSLSVASEPGVGSTFTLTLPLQPLARPPVRVLVIDDEEVSRFLIGQCLPPPAFVLSMAESGEEGLRAAQDGTADIILLDLRLPDLDGLEVLARLKRVPDIAETPVVIVTATALDAAERARLLERADGLVPKSELSRDALGDAIARALGARPRAHRTL